MSKMKDLYMAISELLDTSTLMTAEIAEKLGCPIEIVCQVVEDRWNQHAQEFSNTSDFELAV